MQTLLVKFIYPFLYRILGISAWGMELWANTIFSHMEKDDDLATFITIAR
jgi:hypothetical protein